VYCQLDYLGKCLPGRIRRALDELPQTLDETYERTLREIDDANWEFAQRLFLCVAVTSRPLYVEELAEFLAFDFGAGPIPKYREDWRLEDPLEAVLSTCSTLLALVSIYDSDETHLSNKPNNYPVVQFSHYFVKEFLTSTRFAEKSDTISRRYHVSLTPAHTLVARTCLGILLHFDENITRDRLEAFPLATYAAGHWNDHVLLSDVSQYEEGMKQLFDANKPHLAVWLWIYDPIRPDDRHARAETPLPLLRTPLHYAAFCGFHTVVEYLADQHPQYVHSRGVDDQSTPLHLASRGGHVEVARVLVDCERGIDVTVQDKDGSTPLHEASTVEMARFLIEHGGDATARDKRGSTPLHHGVERENLDLAQFLMEHGADLTARDEHGMSPLHIVSDSSNVALIALLIEYGADVTAQDENGRTPLLEASRFHSGNMEFVQLFVEHGADVKAEDNYGRTPLHIASAFGNLELAKFLIEHGADTTAQDLEGQIPLHYARDVDLVRFLIEHGADITVQDKHRSTLLHQASVRGNVDLAQFLVENGANAAAQDANGRTPLHEASRLDLARFLVENGADATVQDANGRTPLHQAFHLHLAQVPR